MMQQSCFLVVKWPADVTSPCSSDPPPYSAMAMAQCMPPKKDAMLAPYATCKSAAFWRSSAGISGRLAATGGDNATKGITPACTMLHSCLLACNADKLVKATVTTFNKHVLRVTDKCHNKEHLLTPTAWREVVHVTSLLQQSSSVVRLLLLAMLVRQCQLGGSLQLMLWRLAHVETRLVR